MPRRVKTGLDLLNSSWPKDIHNVSAALLIHPASINSGMQHASDICFRSEKVRIRSFWGPQHGIRGETQDNMIEWEGFTDKKTGLPVYSLYGDIRHPNSKMLRDVDVVIIDLQDIGARYYTFIWTMTLVMEACSDAGKIVVVLDRPNPIGGNIIEGPLLKPEYKSFVGLKPLPVRHGMTIGEIAVYLQAVFFQGLQLHVIKMKNWERRMWFDDTGLPWVLPSPNMPTLDSAVVYPGMCLLEATNLSEGRGTTRPFEIFGAPFIDPDMLAGRLFGYGLPGVAFRPLYFQPTFHKYAGRLCGGAQIHVLNRVRFKPFKTTIAILKSIFELFPDDFKWKEPPYEYEERLLPIDILAGSDRVRNDIEDGVDLDSMESWWNAELRQFNKDFREKYLLYK